MLISDILLLLLFIILKVVLALFPVFMVLAVYWMAKAIYLSVTLPNLKFAPDKEIDANDVKWVKVNLLK